MEARDSIIVFRRFDNVIDANIVKTKLDAYGIPCFLTEENITNLYPGNNFITGGTRLHIFSRDEDQVKEVLSEVHLDENDELSRCPRCRSKNVERDISRKLHSTILRWFLVLFAVIALPAQRVNHCLDCDLEF